MFSSSLKPRREWVYFYFSVLPLRCLLAFFSASFYCNCNANRFASVTELFYNHYKIQVLVLVETGAARYVCALLAMFTKPQRLST